MTSEKSGMVWNGTRMCHCHLFDLTSLKRYPNSVIVPRFLETLHHRLSESKARVLPSPSLTNSSSGKPSAPWVSPGQLNALCDKSPLLLTIPESHPNTDVPLRSASDWAQGQFLQQLWESKTNICNPLQFSKHFPFSLLRSFSYTTARKRATQIWFLLCTQPASLLSLSNQPEMSLVNIYLRIARTIFLLHNN